ncbi:MAG: hypothetical protein ACFCVE_10885 [Phycisphaerae bacterium]
MCKPVLRLAVAAVLAPAGGFAFAGTLFTNGPVVTDPTGGTGPVAGLPISQADPFPFGPGLVATTSGVGATQSLGGAAADNFTVPAPGWDLESLTLYAFRNNVSTPFVDSIHINLWTQAPYSAASPGSVPSPLPVPLLAQPLVVPAGEGTLVAYRQGTGTDSAARPIFAYTVSLAGLPNGGELPAGEYWLEFSFKDDDAPGSNIFTPLVSPREAAFDYNARQLAVPFFGSPVVWFEGREGYQNEANPGRAYALPFELGGTVVPEPALLGLVPAGVLSMRRRRR